MTFFLICLLKACLGGGVIGVGVRGKELSPWETSSESAQRELVSIEVIRLRLEHTVV